MSGTATLKYKKISDFFLGEIRRGKYETGSKLPPERELAKQYNLAHMTVNKALNGLVAAGYLERRQGDGTYVMENMPPKTACLVLDYMDDVHAIFPYIMQKALFEAGFVVTVFDTLRISQTPELLEAYLRNSPDLLIVDGLSDFRFDVFKQVPKTTKKIIFQRCEAKPVFDASYVLVDIEKCGYSATRQLILGGKQSIAVVMEKSRNNYDNAHLFQLGCKRALAEFSLEAAVYIRHEIAHESISESDAVKMLQGKNRLDGIVAFMDSELISFIKAADKLDISVPEQLAMIGRCNTPWAERYKLTSVDIRPNVIVENVKNILNLEDNKKIMVAPEIIFRESCPKI